MTNSEKEELKKQKAYAGTRRWYERNKDRAAATSRKWRKKNRKRYNKLHRDIRANLSDKDLAAERLKMREYMRKYRSSPKYQESLIRQEKTKEKRGK